MLPLPLILTLTYPWFLLIYPLTLSSHHITSTHIYSTTIGEGEQIRWNVSVLSSRGSILLPGTITEGTTYLPLYCHYTVTTLSRNIPPVTSNLWPVGVYCSQVQWQTSHNHLFPLYCLIPLPHPMIPTHNPLVPPLSPLPSPLPSHPHPPHPNPLPPTPPTPNPLPSPTSPPTPYHLTPSYPSP